jgi:hypothetical protein
MWVRCGSCDHKWIVAYLPMDMTKVVRLTKRSLCPKCDDMKPNIYICTKPELK